MLLCLFLGIARSFNAEEITDGSETKIQSLKNTTRNKYKIMSIFPDKVGSDGGDTIELKVSPDPNGVPFCKFDTWIVPGRKVSTGIQCNAPELRPGKVSVSVSFDKIKWSDEHVIEVTETGSDDGIAFYLILIVGLVSLAAIAVTFSKLYRKPKKKKIIKRKKRPVRSKSLLDSEVDGVYNRKANVTV